MGLFNRATVAATQESHNYVDVIQNEGENTGRGIIAWRHPATDFNTHSKLLIRRGEEAIFENGASEWAVFPEQTEIELSTQNYAIIRSLRDALSGGQSYFPCRVYFITTEEFNISWGTIEPIGYCCPLLGPGALLRGGGQYKIRVCDSATFARKLLRDNIGYTVDMLSEFMMEFIYKEVAETISNVLEQHQINAMEVSKKAKEIAELCRPKVQELLAPYGLELVDFSASLSCDEEQRQMYEQAVRMQRMTAQGEAQARVIGAQAKVAELETMGNSYTTIKGMELLENLSVNPGAGGVASAGAGLGMGMAAGSAFGSIAQSVFSGVTPQSQQPQTPSYGYGNRFGGDQGAAQPQQAATPDPMETLRQMKQMLDAGLITQQVYDAKVQEVLSRM